MARITGAPGLPPGPLLPPETFKLHQAHYAVYEDLLTDEDGDDDELLLVISLLPTIGDLAATVEAFQSECGGELLAEARQLATKLRQGIAAVRLRFGITEADVMTWHTILNRDEPT